ncbi:hypothetical protein OH77DRAFT_1435367 [Trametes cingulata]|nr:hypothetical protein OH77DRAFT_1435367 [Trametes cingulata]
MARHRPLPLELFLTIRSCIPLADIRTHVCLYNTHPRIAALYDSESDSDDFWERVCWHSGVGALGKDDPEVEHCWRDIALEVIERDGFCKHPQCGEALLAYNARRIARAQNYIKPLSILLRWHVEGYPGVNGFPDNELDTLDGGENPPLTMHRALLRTAFRSKSSGMRDEAQLRPMTDAEEAYKGSVLLKDHPLLERSFATDVPTSIIVLGQLARYEPCKGNVRRDTGVTVYDIMAGLHRQLDEEFDDDDRRMIAEQMYAYGLPDGWTGVDAYVRFRTLRDLLAVCCIHKFWYHGSVIDGGPFVLLGLCGK